MSDLPKFRVFISDVCQLNCKFCGGNQSSMESFQPYELNYKCNIEDIYQIIQAYANNGGKDVQLTGGEPLLNANIIQIVKTIIGMGIRVEINTNAIALTKEMATKLKEAGLKDIKVSLPAFDKEHYIEMTRHDYFEQVCKNIEIASQILNVRINTVATKESMQLLPKMFEFCKAMKIKNLAFLELCYYPELISKQYFMEQHVDFLTEHMPKLEALMHGTIQKVGTRKDFITPVYFIKDEEQDFCVSYKCAKPVYRCDECVNCKTFCQEGLYQLRLSKGGYLNFCNYESHLGIDLHPLLGHQEKLNDAFAKNSQKWSEIYMGDEREFFEKMGLN